MKPPHQSAPCHPPPNLRAKREPVENIEDQIRVIRGHRVLLDVDLAHIYGVPVRRLLEKVRRRGSLPGEFCFQPELHELAISTDEDAGRRSPRYAFTEHGAFLAAILLNTAEAIAMSVQVVRAFVRLRQRLAYPALR